MELVRVRPRFQITLPQSVRQMLSLEVGDFLEAEVKEGNVVLRHKKLVDASQAWYWTPEWQTAEQEAEKDIRAGRLHTFDTADEAIAYLEARARHAEAEG